MSHASRLLKDAAVDHGAMLVGAWVEEAPPPGVFRRALLDAAVPVVVLDGVMVDHTFRIRSAPLAEIRRDGVVEVDAQAADHLAVQVLAQLGADVPPAVRPRIRLV